MDAPKSHSINRIGVVGVGLDETSYSSLTQLIAPVTGAIAISNLQHFGGADRESAALLAGTANRICVIDFDESYEDAIWLTQRIRTQFPEILCFAASAHSDPERIIAIMQAGCSEYLIKPFQAERVFNALKRVEATQKERGTGTHGKTISVIGAKGGTGVTTIALHLAIQLAGSRNGRKCMLVDHHPALGDASLYLGTGRHQYSFYELANNTDRLDEDLLAGFVLTHESGLQILDSPESMDSVHFVSPAALQQTMTFLADTFNYVVVDCPPGMTEATTATILQSDQVAIVLTAELPCVRNAARYLEHLSRIGFHSNNVRIILNRYSKKGPLPDDRIEKALQHPISLRIPNSYQEVIRAINAGVPIQSNSKSDFGDSIARWADEIVGGTQAATAAAGSGGRGLLSFFSK